MGDIIQQLEDLKEWSQDSARYERRLNFRGAGLVQPGPGRQGFWEGNLITKGPNTGKWHVGISKDRKTAKAATYFKNLVKTAEEMGGTSQGSSLYFDKKSQMNKWIKTRPGKEATHPYVKDPDFIEFRKKRVGEKISTSIRDYEMMLSKKNKIVGIPQLHDLLGPDTPYAKGTLKSVFARADKKIIKNMPDVEKNKIKAAQRIKKLIIDTLGEPTTLGEIQKGYKYLSTHTYTSLDKVWDLNEAKLRKLNKALINNYNVSGLRPKTIDLMFELAKNKKFMNAVDAYQGGKIGQDSPILKKLLEEGRTAELSHAYMQLGRVYRGELEMEGIAKNLKRGNRIIKSLSGTGPKYFWGPLGSALLRWSKIQMAGHFDNPNATYEGLTTTIKNAMREVGIKGQAIDEIFPARTGQRTIRQGSEAYNHIIQIIDKEINAKAKVSFDGGASTRFQEIIKARKNKNWEKVNTLVNEHKAAIDDFYEVNPEAKGKVKLTQLNYNPKTHTFASPTEIYGKDVLPSKIQKDIDKFYRKTGLSLDVGSTMTLEKAATDIKKNPATFLKQMGFKIDKCLSSGGRVGFGIGGGVDKCIRGVVNETMEKAKQGDKAALQIFKNQKQVLEQAAKRGTGLATKLSWIFGPIDAPIELAFALPHLLMGDYEAAKRATTFGLTGWGEIEFSDVDDPQARKYLKHVKDTKDYVNLWETYDHYQTKLENLPEDASDALRKETTERVQKAVSGMDTIGKSYRGYEESPDNPNWAYNPKKMAGEKATRRYLERKVQKDLEKGLDATYTKQMTPVGEIDISAYKDAAREELRASPTDLESYIKTKGQDFYGDPEGWVAYRPLKQQEAEAYGVGNIYDDYYMGAAEGKDIRDAYSSIPLEYASQLGALEAKETREGLEAIRERQYSSPLNEMYYAGGGIASLKKK